MPAAAHREESNTPRSATPVERTGAVTCGDSRLHSLRPVRLDRARPPVWARALRGTWRLRWLVLSTARSGHADAGSDGRGQGGATVQPILRPLARPAVRSTPVLRRPRPDRGTGPR